MADTRHPAEGGGGVNTALSFAFTFTARTASQLQPATARMALQHQLYHYKDGAVSAAPARCPESRGN